MKGVVIQEFAKKKIKNKKKNAFETFTSIKKYSFTKDKKFT